MLIHKNKEIFSNLVVLLKLKITDYEIGNFEDNNNNNANHICALCINEINSNEIIFSSNSYHCQCINFWVNLIDHLSFPNLKINKILRFKF